MGGSGRLPALLLSLARNEDYRAVTESLTRSRACAPAFHVRGERWRYGWSPDEGQRSVTTDEGRADVSAPDGEALCESTVDGHHEAHRERRRSADAAERVAAGGNA